jgi:uncharacterized membrane protein
VGEGRGCAGIGLRKIRVRLCTSWVAAVTNGIGQVKIKIMIMLVVDLIEKLKSFPEGTRVLMMMSDCDGEDYAVPPKLHDWGMEKIRDGSELQIEIWEDVSITDFVPGKFERCAVICWWG